MAKHYLIEKYINWKQEHPDEGYQYDEINEFFDELDRGEKQALMEWAANLSEIESALNLAAVIQRSEQLFCGRNVTTCIYFDERKCKNEPSECRDQVAK